MERHIVNSEVEGYLHSLVPAADAVRGEMEKHAAETRFPIVGPLVGRLLLMLGHAVGAKKVFELGSGFGYSAYFFAQVVGAKGRVWCTDRSDKNAARGKEWLGRAGLGERVEYVVGDALAAFSREKGPFDIVFCDIDKAGYPEVPDVALPRLRKGGLLIFDNTLWSGRVVDEPAGDADTAAIKRLNADLAGRRELVTTIVPLRDGVSVSIKL